MDSINNNQSEINHKNLASTGAVEKIKELIKIAGTCFFCTINLSKSLATRPMSVQQVDTQGNLWFLSAKDSHKNQEIAIDPTVQLFFQGSAHSDFLFLKGQASISYDKAKIKELWEPIVKTWFIEGIDDPRISVIKVAPIEGYYWDNKHGNAVAGVKILIGAAVGKTMDDSIEGKISL